MQDNNSLVVPYFKSEPYQDDEASRREGRPIFRDREVCEIRIAGDRNFAPVFPANAMWMRVDGQEITYADRFPEQYALFKEGREQVANGTPLSELPFLTEAKRMELRALKVYTAEALASLDGKPLSNLGQTGRGLKDQAQAYLDNARGSAGVVALAAEVAELKAALADARALQVSPVTEDPDEKAAKAALKDEIQKLTGNRPVGNPSAATLREMLAELTADA